MLLTFMGIKKYTVYLMQPFKYPLSPSQNQSEFRSWNSGHDPFKGIHFLPQDMNNNIISTFSKHTTFTNI